MHDLRTLLQDLGISVKDMPTQPIKIENVTDDSRSRLPNALFVAIEGQLNDGHKYLDSLSDNFVAAIVQKDINIRTSVPLIRTSNTRQILALIAHAITGSPAENILNIGVTGTNGKTTVTYILHYLLGYLGIKSSLIGTTGIFIGLDKIPATHTTPSPIRLAELFGRFKATNIEASVMEVSSHALHQHRVDGISFAAAVFTNLTQDHLDYHGTMEDYANAKKMLFDSLQSSSKAIVFSGDPAHQTMIADTQARVVTAGFEESDNYYISNWETGIKGTRIEIINNSKLYNIQTQLIGHFNVINITLAFATLHSLGYKTEKLIDAVKAFAGVPGRMEIIEIESRQSMAIVDYAHTPDALENALKTLSAIKDKARIICVFGCGGDRDKSKRSLMGSVAGNFADIIIVTSDNPRTEDPGRIASDILSGIANREVEIVLDRATAINQAINMSEPGDIILVAGKGHEDYQIIGDTRIHFSDQEVIRKWISQR